MQSLSLTHKTLPLNHWKKADILHAYTDHKVIWFNLPRFAEMNVNTYQVLEDLSDGGVMVSPKYDSCEKVVSAHIVVTANHPPPKDKLPERILELRAKLLGTEDVEGIPLDQPAFPGRFNE